MPLSFDLSKVPFSRYGSYFSLSIRGGGESAGLYLRTHYDNSPAAFKVDLLHDGETRPYVVEATPSRLTLKGEGGGSVAFVMEGTNTVRVRGRDVSLRLEMPKERWTFAWQLPGAWAFNMSKHQVQLALEPLRGRLDVEAPWAQGQGFCWESSRMVAILSPDEDGMFEAAIDDFLTTWVKPERAPFDACEEEARREYAQWTEGLPEVDPEYEAARDLAAYVNWSAVLAPAGNLTRPTMFMSKYSMCNVYHWDHAFNAMAHCVHQPDLAWDQLLVFYDRQDAHGKPPSSMNRNEIRYTISNPPVQGWALRRMWDRNPGMLTPERMAEAYDYLARWTNWLCTQRTWPGDRLPFYHHGFDSGWDNSSIFDRGVPVVSPDQPAYLVLQMEALADLAEALAAEPPTQQGLCREPRRQSSRQSSRQSWHTERSAITPETAAIWRKRAKVMLEGLLEDLWRGDRFVGVLRPSGETVECESLITCMPIVLGRRLPEPVVQALVARIREHTTAHGPATEKLDSPNYLEGGYWRGPIWAPSTMLIVCGLLDVGETELARQIMKGFCDLCAENGFYENFSPKTGEGHFCPSYTWTSSVFLIFASEYLRTENVGS